MEQDSTKDYRMVPNAYLLETEYGVKSTEYRWSHGPVSTLRHTDTRDFRHDSQNNPVGQDSLVLVNSQK